MLFRSGFTRARRRLICSMAQSRALFGELRFNAPSRFLAEVPKELFGFSDDQDALPSIAPMAAAPMIRRRSFDDDQGPVVDRTYDQSTDFHQSAEASEVKGMRVSHSQFGRGVVLDVNGKGPNAKLTVRFAEAIGVKTVVARFLTPG